MPNINNIRLFFKRWFDKIKSKRGKRTLLMAIPFWVASVITGIMAVLYTKLFLLAEGLSISVLHCWHGWVLFIVSPACFLAAWWLVKRFSTYARGSGIPQVTAAIEIADAKNDDKLNKLLSLRVVFVKAMSSLIMAIGGGAIGREGPTIQMAASIYKVVNGVLPAWWPKMPKANIIITGAAAGLAAAFNTPLGGIVFAIEELTKAHFNSFRTAIFSSVIIAGLTVEAFLGPYLYLGYPKIDNLSRFIFVGVIVVAIIAGLLGSLMSRLILKIIAWKSTFKSNYQHVLFVFGCAMLVAFIACFVDSNILGSGKDLIETLLFTSNKGAAWHTGIVRIIGPTLAFTTGAGGGIFAPALGAGASIGSIVAGWFNYTDTDTNMLILSGMVGFLSGVTRSPFTSAVLVLEMTDHHNVIFHLILASMIASLIGFLVDKHSLYDHLRVKYLRDLSEEQREKQPDAVSGEILT